MKRNETMRDFVKTPSEPDRLQRDLVDRNIRTRPGGMQRKNDEHSIGDRNDRKY